MGNSVLSEQLYLEDLGDGDGLSVRHLDAQQRVGSGGLLVITKKPDSPSPRCTTQAFVGGSTFPALFNLCSYAGRWA